MLLSIGGGQVYAQTYDELLMDVANGIDISERLPPLAELQALAEKNSPYIKMLETDIKMGEAAIKKEKREWLHWVGLEGGIRYGKFDNLVITQDLGLEESNTETTEQTRYNVGGYVRIPLSSIIDRSNVIIAKMDKERAVYQKEVHSKEFRQLVITQYYNVIKEYRGMIIKSNAVENYRVQNVRAKEDFENGIIAVDEYARLEDMLSKAVYDLEDAKLSYAAAYNILEETIGTKIELKE